jgi:hypothetical protein
VLFTDDDPRIEPLRFHDLRASFTSWAYRAGKSDGWISDRTGHLEPKMLERYKRAARTLADLQIVPFPDLSNALPELSTGTVHGRDINDLGRSKRGRRRPKSRQNTQKVRGSRGLWIQSSRVRSPLLTPENVGDRDQAGPTVDSTVDSDSGGSPPLSDPLARAREHLAASVQELVKAGRGADAIALLQAAGSFNAKPAEPEPEPVVDELAARRSRRGAP